jgi:hypothetical protein
MAGGIYLHHIQTFTFGYLSARRAIIAWFVLVFVFISAIYSLGKKPGHSGLAHRPRTAEQIGMAKPSGSDLVFQSNFYMVLSDRFSEGLRPVFTI